MIWLLLIPILWCLGNVKIDAYRIMKDKTIAHNVNGGLYIALSVLLSISQWSTVVHSWQEGVLFAGILVIQMFAARQIWFDIPLNLRRGLKWDYMSTANPPKAWWDRIERSIVGVNGRAITIIYGGIYVISTVALFLMR